VWNEQKQPDTQVRLSWQASPKNKLGFSWYDTTYCFCPTDASLTRAWEAGARADYPLQRLVAGDWTLPATNRVLIEANGLVYKSESNRSPWDELNRAIIPVQEQSTGMRYRADDQYRKLYQSVYTFRGALSYVTGAHAFKVGATNKSGGSHFVDYDL